MWFVLRLVGAMVVAVIVAILAFGWLRPGETPPFWLFAVAAVAAGAIATWLFDRPRRRRPPRRGSRLDD